MKTIEIKGKLRTETGKKSTKKLRKESNVPCVLYGGDTNVHFYGFENDFRHLVYTPNTYIVNLDIDGKKSQAIMREIQFHPVSDRIIHIDFIKLEENKKTKVHIPVKTIGFAKGVKMGGVLHLLKRKLKVEGIPADLPDTLDINIEALSIGKTIKVRDLSFPKLTVLEPAAALVCAVKVTRLAKSVDDATEEDEAVEETKESNE